MGNNYGNQYRLVLSITIALVLQLLPFILEVHIGLYEDVVIVKHWAIAPLEPAGNRGQASCIN